MYDTLIDTRQRNRKATVVFILLFAAFGYLPAQTSSNYALKKYVFDQAGGVSVSAGYSVLNAAGQPSAIGKMSTSSYAVYSGFLGSNVMTTDVADDPAMDHDAPQSFELRQNYPNPFNPETTIEFNLPWRAEVTVVICDMTGRRLRTLISEIRPVGRHQVTWNGRDESGGTVSSGVYIYRITVTAQDAADKIIQAGKMILMK